MRNNHLMPYKPEGFIVNLSRIRLATSQQRTLFPQSPVPQNIGEYENNKHKQKQRMVDEESYYNGDLVSQRVRSKSTLANDNHLPVVLKDIKTMKRNSPPQVKGLSSIQEQHAGNMINNIHGPFDLQLYQQLHSIIRCVMNDLAASESDSANSISTYFRIVSKGNFDDLSKVKLLPNHRQLLKAVIIREFIAVLAVSHALATGYLNKEKRYCISILNYAFQSNILSLYLLSSQSSVIERKIIQQGKQHLLGKNFEYLRTNNELIMDLTLKIVSSDSLFRKQLTNIIQTYKQSCGKALLYGLLSFFAFYLHAIGKQYVLPFLAVAPGPFIIQNTDRPYTLLIDFQRVFISHNYRTAGRWKLKDKGGVKIRPYTSYFLNEMSKYYEIVSFSDWMPADGNKIINSIDDQGVISHRLYSYHIDFQSNRKDISRLGRSLDKVVLLDSMQDPKNTNLLMIEGWRGNKSDARLAQVCPLLAMIAVKQMSTLIALEKIKKAVQKNSSLGLNYINCGFEL